MAVATPQALSVATLLTLGRVSNLPTVWSNVLTGTVLALGTWQSWRTGTVLVAMSLLYVGGMYLNDYFDRAIDARERPGRPIPAGDVSPSVVAWIGFGLLLAGLVAMAVTGTAGAGLVLAALIVAYDVFHKGNPAGPVMMGGCRTFVYVGAAAAVTGDVPKSVAIAGLALLAYVAGLTCAARQESLDRIGNLWPLVVLSAPMVLALPAIGHGPIAAAIYVGLIGWTAHAIYLLARRPMSGAVPRAVGALIAGISLVDAALMAGIGAIVPAALAVVAFAATVALQRFIAGT
jgi:hypothetical protein